METRNRKKGFRKNDILIEVSVMTKGRINSKRKSRTLQPLDLKKTAQEFDDAGEIVKANVCLAKADSNPKKKTTTVLSVHDGVWETPPPETSPSNVHLRPFNQHKAIYDAVVASISPHLDHDDMIAYRDRLEFQIRYTVAFLRRYRGSHKPYHILNESEPKNAVTVNLKEAQKSIENCNRMCETYDKAVKRLDLILTKDNPAEEEPKDEELDLVKALSVKHPVGVEEYFNWLQTPEARRFITEFVQEKVSVKRHNMLVQRRFVRACILPSEVRTAEKTAFLDDDVWGWDTKIRNFVIFEILKPAGPPPSIADCLNEEWVLSSFCVTYFMYVVNPEAILKFMQLKFGIDYERAEKEYLKHRYTEEDFEFLDKLAEQAHQDRLKREALEQKFEEELEAARREELQKEFEKVELPDLDDDETIVDLDDDETRKYKEQMQKEKADSKKKGKKQKGYKLTKYFHDDRSNAKLRKK